ncbi:tRNA-modifying protein YgfZ [Aliivibrio finisterrensis]|uniref:tRNA-modifying protein YgfZ n=1 Tax=Aliivibrio finisterrensis TaxID=511998 RepID=UPI00101F39D9|nr:tRNA-modifying protein YgfZ [Aliivibrio finisterrensis]RYU68024.1 tRNA-modifying protein YgfZ [Aliivibrio finisterrensis]RYU71692.1 tRNA-modifying protein YgfZ [Aliivibrio finisterrensis]RYU75367.1 tRNA-modifying protein YgfZ [Aliivibrio finisterrensis]
MMSTVFSTLSLNLNDPLPSFAISELTDWALITMVGNDKKSYLHGQVTCDVVALTQGEITFGGHCDAKGKLWSIFQLFHHNDGYALFQRKSAIETELTEIKKYAVFSKVDIEISNEVLLGLTGAAAEEWINEQTDSQENVRTCNFGTFAKIGKLQWLLVTTSEHKDTLMSLLTQATLCDESLWELYTIQQAHPQIDAALSNEHIPQALNLQAIDGISFKKGCYTGQETVARAKYRGMNKRAMYLVAGQSEQAPVAGDAIERSVGENWRKGGTIVSSFRYQDGHTLALAILPNDLDSDTQFKLQDAIWEKMPLPYSLDDE